MPILKNNSRKMNGGFHLTNGGFHLTNGGFHLTNGFSKWPKKAQNRPFFERFSGQKRGFFDFRPKNVNFISNRFYPILTDLIRKRIFCL